MNIDPALLQTLIDADIRYTPRRAGVARAVPRAAEGGTGTEDYLHGRPGARDWGGNTVVARYPEPPYMIVRLLRNFARHQREVSSSPSCRIRFERSTVQREWFYTLPLYIGDDARANDGYLEDFYVAQTDGHESTQTVESG